MNAAKLKISKVIRVATIPPVFASILVSLLYFTGDGLILNAFHYVMALFFLAILPVSAYPLSMLFENGTERGTQRKLAIIFSVLGYVAGTVFALATSAPEGELVLYLTYLFSGVLTAFFSFVLKFKASGHTCGVAGPIAMLVYRLGPQYMLLTFALAAVFVTSINLKRHTLSQLISGSIVPVVAMFISIAIV